MSDCAIPSGVHFQRSPTEQPGTIIDDIEQAPSRLRAAVQGLSQEQLDTPIVPEDGRCGRLCITYLTVISTSYVRFKLALTKMSRPSTVSRGSLAELQESRPPH